MSNIVLCPNCGGQKTVSKPPYIAGDVNAWVGSGTPTYSCQTCGGKGWVDTEVDSVSQDDFDNVKFVALSSMETAENLMDECTKRADRIKELEEELADKNRDYKVLKELRDELLEDCEKKRYAIVRLESDISQYEAERKLRIRREGELFDIINDLTDERERDDIDIELLDVILKTINPLIKSGAYARPSTESTQLATQMHGLCQKVVQHRRKHGIVG
jgi:chromosome segregation ATPase